MDSKNQNLELVNVAIQKLMEERKIRETSGESFIGDNDDDQLLLSRLLSQLESLKGESGLDQPKASNEFGVSHRADRDEDKKKCETTDQQDNDSGSDIDKEEIVKELKKVKKQNSVTHWLLSVLIVLTVAWQVSEVSLLLKVTHKVKDGINHPFKYLGGMFTGIFKGPGSDDEENQSQAEAPSLPSLKIPELPHVEVPDLITNHEEH
ncbi:Transmembrane protein [Parasponia andersonii]|uniref:Transmembrane protein n=1 Tax=Parasponia andersonii TaxID=3476 RepID=A0A2P5BPN0_PARAD|nr:Transmembrane protein [Parasponia andersonii]